MLIIRHKTGPLAGTEQRLDGQSGSVVFGRDPDVCQVVFPADETRVGRRHFALTRKPSGQWTFDLFGDEFVLVNGAPADHDATLHSGATIVLGKHGGPSFEVVIEDGLASALPRTQPQEKVKPLRAAVAGSRRFAAIGLLVAVVAAGGAGLFVYQSGEQGRRLADQITLLHQAQARAASETISRASRERLAQSAYLVLRKSKDGGESTIGTAFPVAPNVLATNAHVAKDREEFAAGDRMIVRAPGLQARSYEVLSHKIHPGYAAFLDFVQRDPLFIDTIKAPGSVLKQFGLSAITGVGMYDVALLTVADDAALGPILELASPEEAARLAAGDLIAYAGYPMERIRGSELQPLAPTPEVRSGLVTAMTDMFFLPAEADQRRLIHHDLGITGGSSGSPIIGVTGRVIGIINAGNMLAAAGGGRQPNAALINYAQRIDMLLDLIAGRADAKLAADRDYWIKETVSLKRGFDVIVTRVLEFFRPKSGATATVASEETVKLTEASAFKYKKTVLGTRTGQPIKDAKTGDNLQVEVDALGKIHNFKLKAGTTHVFLIYAQESAGIWMQVEVDGKSEKKDLGMWFSAIEYTADRDMTATIYVVHDVVKGSKNDVNYVIRDYVWEAPKS